MSALAKPEEQQDWSEVTIAQLIEERDAAQRERDEARAKLRVLKVSRRFWINKCRELRRERNHARSLAVLLEQALNAAEQYIGDSFTRHPEQLS